MPGSVDVDYFRGLALDLPYLPHGFREPFIILGKILFFFLSRLNVF